MMKGGLFGSLSALILDNGKPENDPSNPAPPPPEEPTPPEEGEGKKKKKLKKKVMEGSPGGKKSPSKSPTRGSPGPRSPPSRGLFANSPKDEIIDMKHYDPARAKLQQQKLLEARNSQENLPSSNPPGSPPAGSERPDRTSGSHTPQKPGRRESTMTSTAVSPEGSKTSTASGGSPHKLYNLRAPPSIYRGETNTADLSKLKVKVISSGTCILEPSADLSTLYEKRKYTEEEETLVRATPYGVPDKGTPVFIESCDKAKEHLEKEFEAKCKGKLADMVAFGEVLNGQNLRDEMVIKSVFDAFDKEKKGKINWQEFVTQLHHDVLAPNEDKMELIFNIYDLDKNGVISKSEMYKVLSSSWPKKDSTQRQIIAQLVSFVYSVRDEDMDGTLDLAEFCQAAQNMMVVGLLDRILLGEILREKPS